MDLYGQDAELRLLASLAPRLKNESFVDVGAERGSLTTGMLRAGIRTIHAFEPHPDNLTELRKRLGDDPRVKIHPYAISDNDGKGQLYVSQSPSGETLPFGHTVLKCADTDEIVWREPVDVPLRSLGSLVESGEMPSQVGVVKFDTEGNDLAAIRGMGTLEAEVVMVEHWSDLPHGLGRCPWSGEEVVEAMSARGFRHFAFLVHRGEFVTLKWDDAEVERGAMGNLVFVHDRVLDSMLPALLECASSLAEQAVSVGQIQTQAAADRLGVIDELEEAADERLALIYELTRVADERLRIIHQLTGRVDPAGHAPEISADASTAPD